MKKLIVALFLTLSVSALAQDSQTERFLLDQVYRNSDMNVRVEIIKTMRTYASDNDIERALLNLVSDTRELIPIRQEAARSLSAVANNSTVKRALTQAHDRSTNIDFRATLLRSLYKAAPSDSKIRRVLINNLIQNHDIRIQKASAFGLMNAINSSSDARNMINVAMSPMKHNEVRVEVIKTLYNSLGRSEVVRALENISGNVSDQAFVRAAAVRVLSATPTNRNRRNLMYNLVANDFNAIVRTQAAAGLKFKLTETDIRWLRLSSQPGTRAERNPFEL